ncbi:hypothetical protein [Erythrobacter ani]|uniref:Reductase n=1 Tax=Erythrobacter ani TaxID=2827235 RepID=A0ABS6SNY3_9SPHN|nr:hypothetical protein [Erythrobacter ani]MBV7266743.1 hypothetical protein [Erythrobacter ani]
MARSVAIIGAGQIGYAAARNFASVGWDVAVYARTIPDWLDPERYRFVAYVAGQEKAPGANVIVDTIAFDEGDIAAYDPDSVDRLIAVSSASVYCDAEGRTLDEAAQNGFPEFAAPITEENPAVAPGSDTYSTRKVRMENCARDLFGDRATILRPCAIHGAWSRHPREWWFAKRMIDGRERIPLLVQGESVFHTTAANMIGQFAVHAGQHALGGTFNVGDANPPSVMEIGGALATLFGREVEFIPVEGTDGVIGRTPWSVPRPFTVSLDRANESGFDVSGGYSASVGPAIEWLTKFDPAGWSDAFPQLAAYPWDMFDYDAEDRFFDQLN